MRKKNVLFHIFLILTIFGQGILFADESWQGNAAIIRKGEFTQGGLYAASNSFTTNTIILVEDLNTGKTVSATVVKRIDSTSNVFLLLSEDCGIKLGMKPGDVIQVRVSIIKPGNLNYFTTNEELPYNPDPDLYPKTTMTDETDTGFNGQDLTVTYATPTPGIIIYATPTPDMITYVTPTPTSTGVIGPAPTPTATPTPASLSLNDSEAREPQKNLFLPPRDNEKFVLNDLVRPETTESANDLEMKEASVTEQVQSGSLESPKVDKKGEPKLTMQSPTVDDPQLSERTAIAQSGKPDLKPTEPHPPNPEYTVENPKKDTVALALNPEEPNPPVDAMLSADPSQERLKPETKDSTVVLSPENPPPVQEPEYSNAKPTPAKFSDSKVTLESTEPKPPTGTNMANLKSPTPTPNPKATHGPFLTPTPRNETNNYALFMNELKRGFYFIQLGTYSDKNKAINAGTQYATTYPIGIYEPDPKLSRIFKLMIGPLNKDESDTLLYRFRAIGFKDAFVKYVN